MPLPLTYLLIILEIGVATLLIWQPTLDRPIAIEQVKSESGHAFVTPLSFSIPCCYSVTADSVSDGFRSSLKLLADGRPIGPAHSQHIDIRTTGGGAFSHWNGALIFSTPGNTDPRTDGHFYTIEAPLELTSSSKLALLAAFAILGITLAAAAIRGLRSQGGRRLIGTLPDAIDSVARRFGIGTPVPLPLMYLLIILEIGVAILLFWQPTLDRPIAIEQVKSESGHAFVVPLRFAIPCCYSITADSMSDELRSKLRVLADGRPVGPPHSQHVDIRNTGRGAFSHWNGALIFSTPGNTDPRTDGHLYSIEAPLELTPGSNLALLAAFVILGITLAPSAIRGLRSQGGRRLIKTLSDATDSVAGRLGGNVGRLATALVAFTLVAAPFEFTWREYEVSPDSASYVLNQIVDPARALRPPGLSVWIELFSDGTRVSERIKALTRAGQTNRPQLGDQQDPILPVIQAQRVFLAFSFAVFAWTMTSVMPPLSVMLLMLFATSATFFAPDRVLLAFALILFASLIPEMRNRIVAFRMKPAFDKRPSARPAATPGSSIGRPVRSLMVIATVLVTFYAFEEQVLRSSFVSEEQKHLMSEPLAMCWQLLFGACMVQFIWKRQGVALLGAALFAGLAYLTRSASVFLFGILFCLILLALWWDRRRLMWFAVVAAGIGIVTANTVPLVSLLRGDNAVTSAPLLNWGPAAFAVEVAQAEDKYLFHDQKSREFVEKAVAKRKEYLAKSPPPSFRSFNLGADLYFAALPAAAEVLPSASNREISEFLGRTSRPILRERAFEYASVVWESFRVATGTHPVARSTRLFVYGWEWMVLVPLVALAFWGRERDTRVGLLAILFLGMHLTHVVIVCAFDVPGPRYIYATEIFVLVAIGLLLDHHFRAELRASATGWRELMDGAAGERSGNDQEMIERPRPGQHKSLN